MSTALDIRWEKLLPENKEENIKTLALVAVMAQKAFLAAGGQANQFNFGFEEVLKDWEKNEKLLVTAWLGEEMVGEMYATVRVNLYTGERELVAQLLLEDEKNVNIEQNNVLTPISMLEFAHQICDTYQCVRVVGG